MATPGSSPAMSFPKSWPPGSSPTTKHLKPCTPDSPDSSRSSPAMSKANPWADSPGMPNSQPWSPDSQPWYPDMPPWSPETQNTNAHNLVLCVALITGGQFLVHCSAIQRRRLQWRHSRILRKK